MYGRGKKAMTDFNIENYNLSNLDVIRNIIEDYMSTDEFKCLQARNMTFNMDVRDCVYTIPFTPKMVKRYGIYNIQFINLQYNSSTLYHNKVSYIHITGIQKVDIYCHNFIINLNVMASFFTKNVLVHFSYSLCPVQLTIVKSTKRLDVLNLKNVSNHCKIVISPDVLFNNVIIKMSEFIILMDGSKGSSSENYNIGKKGDINILGKYKGLDEQIEALRETYLLSYPPISYKFKNCIFDTIDLNLDRKSLTEMLGNIDEFKSNGNRVRATNIHLIDVSMLLEFLYYKNIFLNLKDTNINYYYYINGYDKAKLDIFISNSFHIANKYKNELKKINTYIIVLDKNDIEVKTDRNMFKTDLTEVVNRDMERVKEDLVEINKENIYKNLYVFRKGDKSG